MQTRTVANRLTQTSKKRMSPLFSMRNEVYDKFEREFLMKIDSHLDFCVVI